MRASTQAVSYKEVTIEGEHVTLRSLGEEDASMRYASWLNDPVVNQYLETRSVSLEDLKKYICEKNADPNVLFLGIFCRKTTKHIGNAKLEPIDWKKRTVMMGILIGDKTYWGRGIGTEVTNLVTDFAFGEMGLSTVTLGVISENRPAIRVYEKCGFTVDHTNKGAINHDGVVYDQIIMSKAAAPAKERVIPDPMLLKRCAKCVMPETQEVIAFDDEGVCNTCRNNEFKKEHIDWKKKEEEWLRLLENYRGKYVYDCVVPFSGGKDSTFTAWALKERYKLKPLIVSFDHHMLRPKTVANRERTLKRLGVDFIGFRPDWHLVKKMMRISLERKGDILWYQHCGIFSYPMQIAVKFNVPLVVWGEPSAEYTGYYGYDEAEEVDERRFNMFVNLGITAQDMLGMLNEHPKFENDPPVTMRDMQPYVFPSRKELSSINCRSVCLGSFVPWDVKSHVKIIQKELGWEGDRVEGVPPEFNYEKVEDMMQGVQDYLKFIKRGYGRMSHLCSIDIRNGRMTRKEALEKIGKWEGKRPASLDVFLKWMEMSEEEFYTIVSRLSVAPWKHDPKSIQREEPLPDQKGWITG